MLNFINNPHHITQKEILECVNLLNNKYKNTTNNIKFYRNKLHAMFSYYKNHEFNKNDFKSIINGATCAAYLTGSKMIHVYSFNIKKHTEKKYLKQHIIYSILHEIRHNYQSIYAPKKFNREANYYISSGEGYSQQWIERDANKFAITF